MTQDVMKQEDELREKLYNLVDDYFPKIKPNGKNLGRGEAMTLVAVALAGIKVILQNQETEITKKVGENKRLSYQLGYKEGRALVLESVESLINARLRKVGGEWPTAWQEPEYTINGELEDLLSDIQEKVKPVKTGDRIGKYIACVVKTNAGTDK